MKEEKVQMIMIQRKKQRENRVNVKMDRCKRVDQRKSHL